MRKPLPVFGQFEQVGAQNGFGPEASWANFDRSAGPGCKKGKNIMAVIKPRFSAYCDTHCL